MNHEQAAVSHHRGREARSRLRPSNRALVTRELARAGRSLGWAAHPTAGERVRRRAAPPPHPVACRKRAAEPDMVKPGGICPVFRGGSMSASRRATILGAARRVLGRIERVKAARITRQQHVVSKVLLKQFAMNEPDDRGPQVRPVDVHFPERSNKLKSARACGWADNYIAYDSASAEDLWNSVEVRAPAAFGAQREAEVVPPAASGARGPRGHRPVQRLFLRRRDLPELVAPGHGVATAVAASAACPPRQDGCGAGQLLRCGHAHLAALLQTSWFARDLHEGWSFHGLSYRSVRRI
ncbi:hypothetical protein SUDANB23_06728 (plasmid) [Streptomyces sp. enrichment culture]